MQANEEMVFEQAEEEGMSNAQLNAFLETLANLVEAKALTVAEAVELIRQAKTK